MKVSGNHSVHSIAGIGSLSSPPPLEFPATLLKKFAKLSNQNSHRLLRLDDFYYLNNEIKEYSIFSCCFQIIFLYTCKTNLLYVYTAQSFLASGD